MLLQQKANGSASEHMEWFLYPFVIIASVIIICFVIPTTIADCLDRKKEKKKRLANQELVQRAQVLHNLNNQLQQQEIVRNKDEGYNSSEDLREDVW